jgi:hypothetical protein
MQLPIDRSATLLRALKGPPLSCLFALLLAHRPLGTNALATRTGYSAKSVTAGLNVLAQLGLAQNHGRYNSWLPTTRCRQMLLGENGSGPAIPAGGVNPETENLRLPPSGSSGATCDPERPILPTTTTTTIPSEPENLRLPDEWQELADLLVERCGTPPHRAQTAIAAARDRREQPPQTRYHVLRWFSYCMSDDGNGINNVGAFIASRIQRGIPCPDWHRPEAWSDLAKEIQRAEAAWTGDGPCLNCGYFPCRCDPSQEA